MDEDGTINEQLDELIRVYGFNTETISNYLGITVEQVERLAEGDIDCLPEESRYRLDLFTKIGFLYYAVTEDKDIVLGRFLGAMIFGHELSKGSIAKMSGVEVSDIDKLLSYRSKKGSEVSAETKYKVAATVMSLRFIMKECDPEYQEILKFFNKR